LPASHLSTARRGPHPALVALLLASVSGSCGGRENPTRPAVPTPLPSPTASASPIVGASCGLGKGDPEAECERLLRGSQLIHYVESAIDLLVREKPQLLDLTAEERPGADTFRVLDAEAYLDAIVANVRRQGACAERDPDDFRSQRVLVKDSNEVSEGFYVLSERGFIQRGGQALDQVCTPASFPVERSADMPPAGSGCGRPYPPPIHHFDAKVHLPGFDFVTLDSTAKVGPNPLYCASIGYSDGRIYCPVRPEGSPERDACEQWRIGRAKDTGRPGPTWTFNGHYCTGPESGCENHPDNQHALWAYTNGTYVMCAENGACGSLEVAR
jgi:hypothetical protein